LKRFLKISKVQYELGVKQALKYTGNNSLSHREVLALQLATLVKLIYQFDVFYNLT
jgi:hypothetical protein